MQMSYVLFSRLLGVRSLLRSALFHGRTLFNTVFHVLLWSDLV